MKLVLTFLSAALGALAQPALAADPTDERLLEGNTGVSASLQVGELAMKHDWAGAGRLDHMAGFRLQAGSQHRFYTNVELSYLGRGELIDGDDFTISTFDVNGKFGKAFAPVPELQLIPYGAIGYRQTDLELFTIDHYELGAGLLTQAVFDPVIVSVDLGVSKMLNARVEAFGAAASLPERPVFSSKITADIPVGSQHHVLMGLDYHRFSYEVEGPRLKFRDPVFFVGYRWAL